MGDKLNKGGARKRLLNLYANKQGRY